MRLALVVVIVSALAGVAAAQEAQPGSPGTPPKRHRAPKPARPAPPSASASQAWHDLVKGSPEQQQMERTDNDLAGIKPVDHRKDEFFSDWRGLR